MSDLQKSLSYDDDDNNNNHEYDDHNFYEMIDKDIV